MGNKQKPSNASRRDFFSILFSKKKTDKIKMLTADGKLVEVDKSLYEQLMKNKKASNKEIYDWMKNPCKDDK